MKPLSLRGIAQAAGAHWPGEDRSIEQICTDTRTLTPGCLFVALSGERFDGHSYIADALAKGAAAVLSERPFPDARVMQVKNTRQGLLAAAGLYRNLIGPKVVAVTGSVGKTTTKEMTACVLESAYKTLKTPKNLNNEVGLSQTIFLLEEDTRAAVLELGIDGPGQMEPLSRCAAPDVGIITGVGITHLANFGSQDGLRREKLLLRAGMSDGAPLLVCGDNSPLAEFTDSRLQVIRYGFENTSCEIRATGLVMRETSQFEVLFQGKTYPVTLPVLGVHNVVDALAAFGAGVLLGVPPEQAAGALANYRPEGMRQNMVQHKGFTVVEDCYNAGPESMRAALETLGRSPGRRIAVLSDMLELGPKEREEHYAIGQVAAAAGIDCLLCTGILSEEYVKAAREAGFEEAHHYPDRDAMAAALSSLLKEGDIVWVKGSRGMKLEQVLDVIYAL